MFFRATFACLALAAACQLVVGLELVEMNDPNKNELGLHLSKALAGVQNAYQNGFKFDDVKKIRKFLSQCAYVSEVISASASSDFKGLAGTIKAIMADEQVAGACSVTDSQLTADFDELDTGFSAAQYDYLSVNVFNKLVKLNERANANENLKTLVHNVIFSRAEELTDALLYSANVDIEHFIGEQAEKSGLFNFDTHHKRLCDISLVEPICKLVRRSPTKVQAIAQDFEDFANFVRNNDQASLQKYSEKSGVTMEEAKANCNKMLSKKMNAFKPIQLIWSYVSAGFLEFRRIEDHLHSDIEFASYNSLYDLCNLVK